jgi:hypothetical protein
MAAPKMIGTVLPTQSSLKSTELYASKVATMQERIGKRIGGKRRVVGGEVRWYKTETEFAVVSRDGQAKWFEIREDGYEYAKR